MGENKWGSLPERTKPEDWVAEKDTKPPLPGALQAAEDNREVREALTVLERGSAI